jgi:hypothetical protein
MPFALSHFYRGAHWHRQEMQGRTLASAENVGARIARPPQKYKRERFLRIYLKQADGQHACNKTEVMMLSKKGEGVLTFPLLHTAISPKTASWLTNLKTVSCLRYVCCAAADDNPAQPCLSHSLAGPQAMIPLKSESRRNISYKGCCQL